MPQARANSYNEGLPVEGHTKIGMQKAHDTFPKGQGNISVRLRGRCSAAACAWSGRTGPTQTLQSLNQTTTLHTQAHIPGQDRLSSTCLPIAHLGLVCQFPLLPQSPGPQHTLGEPSGLRLGLQKLEAPAPVGQQRRTLRKSIETETSKTSSQVASQG